MFSMTKAEHMPQQQHSLVIPSFTLRTAKGRRGISRSRQYVGCFATAQHDTAGVGSKRGSIQPQAAPQHSAEALQFVLGPELLKGAVKVGSGVMGLGVARGVGKTAQHLVNIEKRLERASSGVKAAYKSAREWLGEGSRTITNKAGDLVLMSKDGLRKMRFDIKNPHGGIPHLHLQILKNGEWTDAIEAVHRIYPKK